MQQLTHGVLSGSAAKAEPTPELTFSNALQLDGQLDIWVDNPEVWLIDDQMELVVAAGRVLGGDVVADGAAAGLPGLQGLPPVAVLDVLQLPEVELSDYLLPESAKAQLEEAGTVAAAFTLAAAPALLVASDGSKQAWQPH